MFKAEIENIKTLKSILEGVSRIVDEICIEIDSDGLRTSALDRSHISFIGFDLGMEFFTEFTLDEPLKVYVDCDELLKIIRRGKTDDTLIISADENNITIIFDGEAKRTFTIRQIDAEYTSQSLPDVPYTLNNLPIPFTYFKDSMGDIGMCGDKLLIHVNETYLTFEAQGDFSEVKNEYIHGFNIEDGFIQGNVYSLEYINNFLKINGISDTVLISTGENNPLFLKLESNDGVKIEFLLAPRLEDDV